MGLEAPSSNNTNAPWTVDESEAFQVVTLSSDTFVARSASTFSQRMIQSWSTEKTFPFTGKVTCSVPFTSADGRSLIAVGCSEGVWIGPRHDSKSLQRVLHLKNVTQCAVLEYFGMFIVLADMSLSAYDIEALVHSLQSADISQTPEPQKLSPSGGVHFFSIGVLGGRTLVVYKEIKGRDSVFRILEPVIGKINKRTEISHHSQHNLWAGRSEWFRVYQDFFLPKVATHDVVFLKARIVILCKEGFEVLDLSDFRSVTIPQLFAPSHKKLAKRCKSGHPVGMFRSNEDEFLLCYDKFGLYVNRQGEPSPSKDTIEWESTAEHAAWHPPYVLLFNSSFIEVRHVGTGRLCQIIRGQDLQCTWDGCRSSSRTIITDLDGTRGVRGVRVHGVMRADDNLKSQARTNSSGNTGGIVQQVFELALIALQGPSYTEKSASIPLDYDNGARRGSQSTGYLCS